MRWSWGASLAAAREHTALRRVLGRERQGLHREASARWPRPTQIGRSALEWDSSERRISRAVYVQPPGPTGFRGASADDNSQPCAVTSRQRRKDGCHRYFNTERRMAVLMLGWCGRAGEMVPDIAGSVLQRFGWWFELRARVPGSARDGTVTATTPAPWRSRWGCARWCAVPCHQLASKRNSSRPSDTSAVCLLRGIVSRALQSANQGFRLRS